MKKEKLFSMTSKDFEFIPTKGRGKGGQSRNKTLSAMICKHESSGAEGYAEDSKDQRTNKQLAFKRMTETKEFKSWFKVKCDAALGHIEIEENGTTRKVNHEEIK